MGSEDMTLERSNAMRFGAALVATLGMGIGSALPGASAHGRYVESVQPTHREAVGEARTDQIMVRLRTDVAGRMTVGQQRAAVESIAASVGHALAYGFDQGGGLHTLRLAKRLTNSEVQAIAAQLELDPRVAHAEPDRMMRALIEPNDELYWRQWDLLPVAGLTYGANLPEAWDIEKGDPSIAIAVVDTGYRPHVDLAGRFLPGYDFVHDIEVANDGDARDADARDPGDWITAEENESGYFWGCGKSDSSWHGTHVAGTIGAVPDNGVGVAGINWNARIVPVRVLGKCGGYSSDIIAGMRWAAGLSVPDVPANGNPARVINLSLGGPGMCSTEEQSAIDAIVAQGTVVVVAAGNEAIDASLTSPANCDGVITVAAMARYGGRASYSNYGALVEIAAPGGDKTWDWMILSTLNDGTTTPGADSYKAYQGTSMAAPHVAGIASLLLSANPCLTPSQVLTVLRMTATDFPVDLPSGFSEIQDCRGLRSCGEGIVNAGAAVAVAKASKTRARAAATSASLRPALPASPFQVRVPVLFRDKFWVPCL
jgi:serine protease